MLLCLRAFFLVKKLKKTSYKLALAESCTGGMLAALITKFSGVSNFFDSSLVTYSNKAKSDLLLVKKDILKKYGAVSSEVALVMAENLHKIRKTDISLSITGIAGPKSDDSNKPVGLVYIALINENQKLVKKFQFSGGRNRVRKKTCAAAIKILREI